MFDLYYFFIKFVFFFGILRSLIKFEPLQKHYLFLGILYTAGVAFISYVFLVSWQNIPFRALDRQIAAVVGVSPWVAWLGETLVLSTVYFRMICRFDEGVIFWTLLLLGILVVLF